MIKKDRRSLAPRKRVGSSDFELKLSDLQTQYITDETTDKKIMKILLAYEESLQSYNATIDDTDYSAL